MGLTLREFREYLNTKLPQSAQMHRLLDFWENEYQKDNTPKENFCNFMRRKCECANGSGQCTQDYCNLF